MNNEVEVETTELNGKEYFLIDEIETIKTTYYYYGGIDNPTDIQVLKKVMENNEEYYQSVDTENELIKAYALYYEKHKNDNLGETTI